jgi:D-sedoheptulose 7-phosphate isomerase
MSNEKHSAFYHDAFKKRLDAHQKGVESLHALREALVEAAQMVRSCVRSGGKILACGNGGSAAEAQHFTTELIGRYRSNRQSLPAVPLTADGSAITCIGNDFGWENIFARQLEGFAKPGDLLLAFSTSGNSPNIVRALERARELKIKSIALLGKDGGAARKLADHGIVIQSNDTGAIQEAHLIAIHFLCEGIEELAD